MIAEPDSMARHRVVNPMRDTGNATERINDLPVRVRPDPNGSAAQG
jgi:hypothetical protein